MVDIDTPTPTQTSVLPVSPAVQNDGVVPPPGYERWPAAVRALAFREYRILWGGQLISNVGTWMQVMAQAWVVYTLSGKSEFWLGVDGFCSGAPVLLAPFAGVLADRLDRRKLMGGVTILQGILAFILALMLYFNVLRVWEILICSVFSGALSNMMMPTFNSLMPELVDHPTLPNAVALNSMGFNVSRVLGPMIGGIVLAQFGATWSFGFNALSFVAVLMSLVCIHPPSLHQHLDHPHPLESLLQGMRYIRGRADLMVMLAVSMVTSFFMAPVMVMLPAYAEKVIHLNGAPATGAYAALLCWFGVGGMMGATILALSSGRKQAPWRAFPLFMLAAVVEVVMGLTHSLPIACVLVCLEGLLFIGTLTRLSTAIVSSTPSALRGRTSSFFFLSIAGAIPVGAVIAGWVARAWRIDGIYWVAGALMGVGTFVVMTVARRYQVAFAGPARLESAVDVQTIESV